MNNNSEHISAYVSSLVLQRIENSDLKKNLPDMVRFPAAVLFADISGFTTFTEELDTSGPEGIEVLADILNQAFSNLITIVYEHGGDVVKFAGDALWAIWRSEDNLDDAIHQSLFCAQKIQEAHSIRDASTVNLRVSLSAGEISVLHVGGGFNRWEMIIAGPPLLSLGTADRNAKPGEICFAGKLPISLLGEIEARPIEEECFRIDSVNKPPNPPRIQIKRDIKITDTLRGYIPGAILKRMDAGQSEWLAEIRHVSVVFLRVTGLDYQRNDSLEKAHNFMRNLQKIIYRHEGSLNRLNVDDKGTIMLAAFGLPPLSHDDDPIRAMNAMWEIREMLFKTELKVSIGITTGRAFCGALGNEFRREYTMHGDTVNLAARLMQKASEGWGILCDEFTYREVRNDYAFEALLSIPLKGRKALANLYSPKRILFQSAKQFIPVPCREEETNLVENKIEHMAEKKSGGVIIVDGEPGIGKSIFARNIVERNKNKSFETIYFSGDSFGHDSPFFSIRKLMKNLVLLLEKENRLNFPDDLVPYRSLLNTKSRIIFPESENSRLLTKTLKLDIMKDLFLVVFNLAYSDGPVFVVVDECHLIDSYTWEFLNKLRKDRSDILFLLLSRISYDYERLPDLMKSADADHITLGSLSDSVILEIASKKIGKNNFSESLKRFLLDYSEGHPYFASEIAGSLMDNDLLVSGSDVVSLKETFDPKNDFQIYEPAIGIITEKIDRLSPEDQLVLKVASVLGRDLNLSTLMDIFPIQINISELKKSMDELVKRGFLTLNSIEGDYSYTFRRSLVQMTVFNMLLFSQRKRLKEKLISVLRA